MLRTLFTPRRSRSTRPCLNPLEPRLLLAKAAAQVSFLETDDGTGSGTDFLKIAGTSKNDTIFITDDGKHAAGSLKITANGTQTFTNTKTISTVFVATGTGKDKVFYNLAGGLSAGPTEAVVVGSSMPQVSGVKGGGDIQFIASVNGPIPKDTDLFLFAIPDKQGATSMTVNQTGTIDGFLDVGSTSQFGSISTSHTGPVTFNFNTTATLDPGGTLLVLAGGGAARNQISTNYTGTNNGNLLVVEGGNGSNDVISANIQMTAGSTGVVGKDASGTNPAFPSTITANGKNPKVRFTIFRGADSTSTTGVLAQVTAKSKKSVTTHTANVAVTTSGKDSVVS